MMRRNSMEKDEIKQELAAKREKRNPDYNFGI